MIKINQCSIDADKTVGNKLLLTNVQPAYKWVDGKPTRDLEGYKYEVASEKLGLDKLSVKIEGDQKLEFNGKLEQVKFEGLEMSIYWRNETPMISAKATNIYAVRKQNAEQK